MSKIKKSFVLLVCFFIVAPELISANDTENFYDKEEMGLVHETLSNERQKESTWDKNMKFTFPKQASNESVSAKVTCTGTDVSLNVFLRTDSYPGETYWAIVDYCSGGVATARDGTQLQVYETFGNNILANEWYSKEFCLPEGGYDVRLQDRGPDGDWSVNDGDGFEDVGDYNAGTKPGLWITLNGETVYHVAGNYGTYSRGTFTTPGHSCPPTDLGSLPTRTCGASETNIIVRLLTDLYPGDTDWGFMDTCTGSVALNTDQTLITQGNLHATQLQANTLYISEFCLPEGSYTYALLDSYGDGFGLWGDYSSGTRYGFEYFINGEQAVRVQGNYGSLSTGELITSGFTVCPSMEPSATPVEISVTTESPVMTPSYSPSNLPSFIDSLSPSDSPSVAYSHIPSDAPVQAQTNVPSDVPSNIPSFYPSDAPTGSPVSAMIIETVVGITAQVEPPLDAAGISAFELGTDAYYESYYNEQLTDSTNVQQGVRNVAVQTTVTSYITAGGSGRRLEIQEVVYDLTISYQTVSDGSTINARDIAIDPVSTESKEDAYVNSLKSSSAALASLITISAVELPFQDISSVPSLSYKPSSFPSIIPSLSPSTSFSPSTMAPTQDRSVLLDKWQINFDKAYATNNQTSILEGITFQYLISKMKTVEQLTAAIYDESCETLSNSTVISVINKDIQVNPNSEFRDFGLVSVQIDDMRIETSPFWSQSNQTQGLISFCVKSDLLMSQAPHRSVSFSQTKANLKVNFEADFSTFTIEDIELVKFNVTEIEEDAQFEIESCICDDNLQCVQEPVIKQNSAFVICVFSSDADLEISEYESVALYQDGEAKYIPIENGVPDEVTSTTLGFVGTVSTRILSDFFNSPNPSAISISGEVLLDFAPERRGLKIADGVHIHVREEKWGKRKQGNFEINVEIEKVPFTFSNEMIGVGLVSGILCYFIVSRIKNRDMVETYVLLSTKE